MESQNRQERVKSLQNKASTLLEWFYECEIPAPGFLLSQGETCLNALKMVHVAICTMDTYFADPFAKPFVSAYLRLNNLKIYIEREKIKQSGLQPRKRKKAAIVRN